MFTRSSGSKAELFYKSYGSESIRTLVRKGTPAARIVASWTPSLVRFASERKPFLLY